MRLALLVFSAILYLGACLAVLTSTFKLMLNAGMEKATTTFYHGQ